MYPVMVAKKFITQDEAEAWIDIIEAIWADYEEREDRRQRAFSFGTPGDRA
jgi:hypothetical protein